MKKKKKKEKRMNYQKKKYIKACKECTECFAAASLVKGLDERLLFSFIGCKSLS
jgi:hypothetical protein